jgi:hypothetical protein
MQDGADGGGNSSHRDPGAEVDAELGGIPLMTRFRGESAALDEHWQGRTIAVVLRQPKSVTILMSPLSGSSSTSPDRLRRRQRAQEIAETASRACS